MSQIRVRTITKEDIDFVVRLEHIGFSEPWPRSAFEEIVDKKDAQYYVAQNEAGEILGGCAMFFIAGEGDITNVAVFPEYRNQGIATKLLQYVVEDGRKHGLVEFTLEVRVGNKSAIRAYEKVGFESEGIRPNFYSHPKEDALIMWIRE